MGWGVGDTDGRTADSINVCECGVGLSCLSLQFYPFHWVLGLGTAGDSLSSSPRGRRANAVWVNLSHKWAPPCMPLELFVARGAQRQESLRFLIGQSRKSASIRNSYHHQPAATHVPLGELFTSSVEQVRIPGSSRKQQPPGTPGNAGLPVTTTQRDCESMKLG